MNEKSTARPPKKPTWRTWLVLLILLTGSGAVAVMRRNTVAAGANRLPWTSYEAEDGECNASIHGPSRTYLTPEAESSGRKFVRLDAVGESVEFKVREAADAITVRYVIPDSPGGGGIAATLSLYVNGKFAVKLPLTSRYAWNYGDFPWSNDPSKGRAHHFYDESHAMIGQVSPGDVIRLQKDASDTAGYYLIDLIELEKTTSPLSQPADSLSICDFGATANDSLEDSAALEKCIDAAKLQGKTVWVPPGEFLLNASRIRVGNVRVRGAGMWYSTLTGHSSMFEGTGQTVEFSDLAIFGEISHRNDDSPDNAFNGNFGKDSLFQNLWIEHFKCGFWTTHGTDRMRVESCRIRNTMADGLNFCDGTSHSEVRNCHLRNTGDDALATWSPAADWSSRTPCIANAFVDNTIQLPWHANGIALYGGSDHLVANNKINGTVFSGGGILVSSGFGAIPFSGTIRLNCNTITDAGGDCYIGETVGGLWIHAKDSDIDPKISVCGLRMSDCPNSAITVHGPGKVADVSLKDVEIVGVGECGVDLKSSAVGTLHVSDLRISGNRLELIRQEQKGKFSVITEASAHQ